MVSVRDGYKDIGALIAVYWKAYGGWAAFWRSPYVHAAVLITLVQIKVWTNPEWWADPLSIVPSVLGFTLGGYAILIAFGDERFRNLMITSGSGTSPFVGVSAAFLHFIVVQFLALAIALLAKSTYFELGKWAQKCTWLVDALAGPMAVVGWGIGYFLFVYSLLLALASALAIFRLSTWFEMFVRESEAPEEAPAQREESPAGSER